MVSPSNPSIKEALDRAAILIKQGNLAEGKAGLEWVLERDPDNVLAWLWMTRCVTGRRAKLECYQRVLSIDSNNEHALKGIDILNSQNGSLRRHTNRRISIRIVLPLMLVIGIIAGLAAWLLLGTGKFASLADALPRYEGLTREDCVAAYYTAWASSSLFLPPFSSYGGGDSAVVELLNTEWPPDSVGDTLQRCVRGGWNEHRAIDECFKTFQENVDAAVDWDPSSSSPSDSWYILRDMAAPAMKEWTACTAEWDEIAVDALGHDPTARIKTALLDIEICAGLGYPTWCLDTLGGY